MATTVARLEAVLSAQTRDFDRAMDQSHSKMGKLGKAAGVTGFAIAAGLGVVAKVGWNELKEAQKVTGQTNAVLKSTGGLANVTAKHVDTLATAISNYSGMDDEAVQSGENMLLTFRDIRNRVGKNNDIFDQATVATADLSQAMGMDMPKAALQLGKALNDPERGMSRLQRIGVTFTDKQKELVKHFMATGQTAKAQKVILHELTLEFGGSAKAAGETLGGQLRIAKERFSDVAGELVKALLPAFLKFSEILVKATKYLSEHPRLAKILAIGLGILAGALIAASVAQRIMNLAVLANPYAAAAAAIAVFAILIYKNWGAIKEFVLRVLASVRGAVTGAWSAVKDATFTAMNAVKSTVSGAWTTVKNTITNALSAVIEWLRNHWVILVSILAGPIGAAIAQIVIHRDRIVEIFKNLPGKIAGAFTGGVKVVKDAIVGLFGKVIGWVKDVLGIKSPSSVFHSIGQNVVRGFVNGVGSMAGVLKSAVVGMVKSLPGDLLGGIGKDKLPKGGTKLIQVGKWLQGMGFQVSENPAFGGVTAGAHVAGSYHYKGRAIDVNWPGGGSGELNRLRGVFNSIKAFGPIEEMIEDAGKANQHLHIAFDKGGIVPGPVGAPMAAIVHGGETILPTHKGGGDIIIPVSIGGEHVATVVFDMLRRKARVFEDRNGRPAFGGA